MVCGMIATQLLFLFHNLADLTDRQSWKNRTWVFDTETDIFVSNCEADCLTRHDLKRGGSIDLLINP